MKNSHHGSSSRGPSFQYVSQELREGDCPIAGCKTQLPSARRLASHLNKEHNNAQFGTDALAVLAAQDIHRCPLCKSSSIFWLLRSDEGGICQDYADHGYQQHDQHSQDQEDLALLTINTITRWPTWKVSTLARFKMETLSAIFLEMANPNLDYEAEIAGLTLFYNARNEEVVDNPGDGKCMYYAIADAFNSRDDQYALKQIILSSIERNEDSFPGITWQGRDHAPLTMRQYIEKKKQPSEWGGEAELTCLATLLHRVLNIQLVVAQWRSNATRETIVPPVDQADYNVTESDHTLLQSIAKHSNPTSLTVLHVRERHYLAARPTSKRPEPPLGAPSTAHNTASEQNNSAQSSTRHNTMVGDASSQPLPITPKSKSTAKRTLSVPRKQTPQTVRRTRQQTATMREEDAGIAQEIARATSETAEMLGNHLCGASHQPDDNSVPSAPTCTQPAQDLNDATNLKLSDMVKNFINTTANGGRTLLFLPRTQRQAFISLARALLRAWHHATDIVEKTEHLLSFLALPMHMLPADRGGKSRHNKAQRVNKMRRALADLHRSFDERQSSPHNDSAESASSDDDASKTTAGDGDSVGQNPIAAPTPSQHSPSANTRAQSAQRQRHQDAEDARDPLLDDRLFRSVASNLHQGHSTRAMRLLQRDASVADTSLPHIRDELASKHPAHELSPEARQDMQAARHQHFPVHANEDLRKFITSFDNGSAPGYDGFSAKIIKVLVTDPECFSYIAEFIDLIANGAFNPIVAHIFKTCTLIGLEKKGKTRPIAIAPIFYRMAAKLVANKVMIKAKALLSPIQLGVGVSSACEVIVHHVRQTLRSKPEWAMCQLDFKNAFNCISKSKMLSLVMKEPTLACMRGIVKMTCAEPSTLMLRQEDGRMLFDSPWNLWSQQGTRQGDNLSPILFDIALQHLLVEFQKGTNPELETLVSYQDDTTLIGAPLAIAASFTRFQALAKELLDLEIQPAKCVYVDFHLESRSPAERDAISAMNITVEQRCSKLLGSPIGPNAEAERPMMAEIVKSKIAILDIMRDPRLSCQDATALIRKHVIPGFTFFQRTTLPETSASFATVVDDSVRNLYLEKADLLLDFNMASEDKKAEIRRLVTATIKIGGTGLIPTCLSIESAHIAGMVAAASTATTLHQHFAMSTPMLYPTLDWCLKEVHTLMETVNQVRNASNSEEGNIGMRKPGAAGAANIPLTSSNQPNSSISEPQVNIPATAQSLLTLYSTRYFENIPAISFQRYIGRMRKWALVADHLLNIKNAPLVDQIRFQAILAPFSNQLMRMSDRGPFPVVDNRDWKYYQSQIWGLKTHHNNSNDTCSFCCEKHALEHDQLHYTACKQGHNQKSIVARHDSTKRIFARHLSQFGIVFQETNDWIASQKRADVQFTNGNESFLIDIQHTNPLCLSLRLPQRVKATILFAAKSREKSKELKYKQSPTTIQNNPDAIFIPAVFEAFGGFGPKMQEFIKKITVIAIKEVGPIFAHELIQDFINDIACDIVKCNADMYRCNASRIDHSVSSGTYDES